MRVLAVDTALAHCQAAVVSVAAGTTTLGAAGGPSAGDSEAIVAYAADALRGAAVDFGDIDCLAVTIGPGSFTGVRVGIAYAKGLAMARDLPLVGVSTLEALAAGGTGPILSAVDARHGAVFAQLFGAAGAPPPARLSVSDAARLAAQYDAAIVVPEPIAGLGEGQRPQRRIDLGTLASLAAQRDATPAETVGALYLAPVDATPQSHKSLAL